MSARTTSGRWFQVIEFAFWKCYTVKCSKITLRKDLEKFIDDGIDKCANRPIHTECLLIEDGFRCELERFILALAASTVRTILLFWFQKEDQKIKKRKKKRRGAVVSNSNRHNVIPASDPRSASIACANATTWINALFFTNIILVSTRTTSG